MAGIPLGVVPFKSVTFDDQELGKALQRFVEIGSLRHNVQIDQLRIITRNRDAPDLYTSVAEAIENGTRLFDALAYFSLPVDDRPKVVSRPSDEHDPTMAEIAKAVYFVYMFIMLRGRVPTKDDTDKGKQLPKFFQDVMGLDELPQTYITRIASFNLQFVSPSWVKYIPVPKLGAESRNRLGLNVAGYRTPAAFRSATLNQQADPIALRAAEAVRKFAAKGPVWDCHPATRTAEFSARVVNFNANCSQLLLASVSEVELRRLAAEHTIFEVPIKNDRYSNWKEWTDATFAKFEDLIFPEQPTTPEDQH